MTVIYVDTLFALNLAADWICLSAAGRLCDRPSGTIRRLAASAAGGLYAVGTVLPGLEFLRSAVLIPVSAVFIVWVAFGARGILRMTLAFMASAALFGGTVWAAAYACGMENLFSEPRALRAFLIGAGLCCGGCSLMFRRVLRRAGTGGVIFVEAERNGQRTSFHALVDTGNSLRDPVTGDGVMVCEREAVWGILTEGEKNAVKGAEGNALKMMEGLTAAGKGKWRLIPYSAVGVEGGLLPAFRPDRVVVDGRDSEHILFAVSSVNVSDGGAYSALAGTWITDGRGK